MLNAILLLSKKEDNKLNYSFMSQTASEISCLHLLTMFYGNKDDSALC